MRLVLCAEGPIEPMSGLRYYLSAYPATEHDPVHIVFGMRRTPPPDFPGLGRTLTVGTFLPGRGLRAIPGAVYDRRSYSEICRALIDGTFAPSVVIACATTPDGSGARTLGAVNGYLELALQGADHIVVEEVDWLPRIPGAAVVPRADDVVPTEHVRGESQPGFSAAPREIDFAIADNVASLIPRDAKLALGIGRVNVAVTHHLAERKDIEIVTGVVTDGMALLADRWSPSRPIQAMSVVGSDDLMAWSQSSGAVSLLPSTQIHEPAWLAAQDQFVAVLGAIEIDCMGNVNAERTGTVLVSGKGGAPDFALGAHKSPGGRSIVAMSANHRPAQPRLVQAIEDPTIPAEWIDAVVTEYGVALLTGLDEKDRALALRKVF